MELHKLDQFFWSQRWARFSKAGLRKSDFSEITRIDCVVARIYVSKKFVQKMCCFSKSGGKSLHFFLFLFDTQEGPF